MCALFGWLDVQKIVPHKILKKLTQALANAAEERGTDASGIAYVKNGKVTIYKRPKPAHKLKFRVPEETKVVMGHTRLTTQGNQKFNWNNHPFPGYADKQFAFAHNGVLYNDSTIRREKGLPGTPIETDSYVAVQLIEKQGKLDFNSLKSMAEEVHGSFTFTILDENNKLYFVKGSSPLYLIYFELFGLYVYASTENIMKQALREAGLQKYAYEVIPVYEGDILSVDQEGKMERAVYEVFQYSVFSHLSTPYGDYYTGQEELLLEMCSCFGVDREDIILLLEYGYRPEEIEEMLMEGDVITDAARALRYEDTEFYNHLCRGVI